MVDRGAIFSAPMVCALIEGRKTQTRRLATSPLRRCVAGDRLWVRETFVKCGGYERYPATDAVNDLRKKTPAIHMPRWASRLTLILADVRTQPLHDITEEDAIAEGIVHDEKKGFWVPGVEHPNKDFPYLSRVTAREMYAALWDVIHGSGKWLENPDVVALTFRVEIANIDRLGTCDLCAGVCRGHSLGHPEQWQPEPGSKAWIADRIAEDSENGG